jgi:ADP-ribosylglycohydrolase
MARATLNPVDRARGVLLGLAGAEALARGETAWAAGEAALAALLAEELAGTRIDLHRLVHRWLDWWRRDGAGVDARTADALAFLAAHDAPAPPGPGAALGAPLARVLPVGVAFAGMPRNLVSGTYHIVYLTHPDPRTAWSAVAVNVAVARFAQGRRDFVADVIEVLRANDAPPDLIAVVRRVPLMRREDLRWWFAEERDAVAAAELGLWFGYHEPQLPRAVESVLAAGDASVAAPLVGGMLGARDGEPALVPAWLNRLSGLDRWRQLGKGLVARPAAA